MIIQLLDAHAGRHAANAAALLAVPQLFRRMRLRRKAAPGAHASGAGTGLTTAQQLAHANAMHEADAPLADAQQRRPVNGRSLGTLPRRKPMVNRPPWETAELPVYGEHPVAEGLAAEEEADRRAAWYQHVPAAATYRGGWQ